MKPKQFVETLREEIEYHLSDWYEKCQSEYATFKIPFSEFVKQASLKPKRTSRKSFIASFLSEQYKASTVVEIQVDGAQYRILNKPTALAYAYKHAARAI